MILGVSVELFFFSSPPTKMIGPSWKKEKRITQPRYGYAHLKFTSSLQVPQKKEIMADVGNQQCELTFCESFIKVILLLLWKWRGWNYIFHLKGILRDAAGHQ